MEASTKYLLIQKIKLKNELSELTGRINRLRLYLDNPHTKEEAPEREEDYWLLEGQFRAMLTYQAFLTERLMYLKGYVNEGDK